VPRSACGVHVVDNDANFELNIFKPIFHELIESPTIVLPSVMQSTDLSTAGAAIAVAHEGVLRVVLNAPLRTAFEYLAPPGIAPGDVPLGARVRVPLGRRSTVGIVVDRAAKPSLGAPALKAVHELLDGRPLLDERLMQLLRWTADYYHHPLGEVIASALPKLLKLGGPASRRVRVWRLSPAGRDALAAGDAARAPLQLALMQLLATACSGLDAAELTARLPTWRRAAGSLSKRSWIEIVEVTAAPTTSKRVSPLALTQDSPVLSPEQGDAVAQIGAASGCYEAFVLNGATGSGKTEVYLQCAMRALERGGAVLVLVPEIGLTPQLVRRFEERLDTPVAVLHSGLKDAERLAAWRAARDGSARIVLGTRSAVFAPLPDLSLIVIDEEHDSSYKQYDGGCRYSARDVAVVRAHQSGIPIVLGSATPSFETLHNAARARYRTLRLPRRTDQAPPPRLALVDLRSHTMRHGLAIPVIDAIGQHLSQRRQVMVFINRRGYAPTLVCTSCGWIAPCPNCDARLTVHSASRQLRCHHCGHAQALPDGCVRCGFTVKAVGQGTERVEEVLRQLFPAETLMRLDRDSAASARALEAIMQSVRSGATRILVGTQMITKGHHFPDVGLVVVLNADQGLFSTDYRAAERLAQTIVQVAGRAGRETLRGEVLLQTEYPDHPLLQSLLRGGYDAFADTALAEREAARWPPFGRLALLRASSPSPDGALEFLTAARAAAAGSLQPAVRLLGPVPASMPRRAGRYYAQLLIECTERAPLHQFIDAWLPHIESLSRTGRVRYVLDVDPIDIQ
jgi:primosomal protein N' (replication factor Y)